MLRAAPNETIRTLGILWKPVIFSVVLGWLLFDVGRGLRRFLPWARRGALVFLVPACVPPLVVFFSAMRAGAYPEATLAVLVLALPALAIIWIEIIGKVIDLKPWAKKRLRV